MNRISALPAFDQSRFWNAVDRSGGPRNCWAWTGAKSTAGYGRFKIAGRLYSPHRIAYILEKGHFLEDASYHGTVVRHTCDNPSCCNPLHLRLGTQKDNVADMDAMRAATASARTRCRKRRYQPSSRIPVPAAP